MATKARKTGEVGSSERIFWKKTRSLEGNQARFMSHETTDRGTEALGMENSA
jgi:hypothetical protein